jgi:hypothetical protein
MSGKRRGATLGLGQLVTAGRVAVNISGGAAAPTATSAGARKTQRRCNFLNDSYSAGHQGRRSAGAWSQALRGHPGTRWPKELSSCSTIAHSPSHRLPRSASRRSRPSWRCRRCLRLRWPSLKAPTSRLRHPTPARACRSPPTARPVAPERCVGGPLASSAWDQSGRPACSRRGPHRAGRRWRPAPGQLSHGRSGAAGRRPRRRAGPDQVGVSRFGEEEMACQIRHLRAVTHACGNSIVLGRTACSAIGIMPLSNGGRCCRSSSNDLDQ